LVDVQRDLRLVRTLDGQGHALLVRTDGQIRRGADLDLVTERLDRTFVVGVRDGREDSRVVEVLDQLAGPDFLAVTTRRASSRLTCFHRRPGSFPRGLYVAVQFGLSHQSSNRLLRPLT
jgi:hypothetical protein